MTAGALVLRSRSPEKIRPPSFPPPQLPPSYPPPPPQKRNRKARIAPAFGAIIQLSTLNGLTGFRLNGVAAGDISGRSVSDAGDVNGDGFDDLLIGAPAADPSGLESGASYVIFGKAGGFASALNLSTLNGANGFKISGETSRDFAGASVSGAGDVNGDGFDDVVIGAYGADFNGILSGSSYVVFGKAGGFPAALSLSTLTGANGFQIDGAASPDFSGVSVSGAGDVNGDGFDDVLIGARGADNNGAGYVVFGKADGFVSVLKLSTLDGANGFKISGEAAQDFSGTSVSGAGDINGDGFDDLFIGAPSADPNGSASGASYVVFGKAAGFASTLSVSTLDGANGFRINGETADDQSGRSVSGAGDVNGDGFADLLIGALADPNGSATRADYLVFGKASGFAAALNLSTLDGTNGFRITGGTATNQSGVSVSGAGDVNGDGFDDLLIGAPYATTNGLASGASYLVFGKTGGFGAALNLSTLDGANGFKLSGAKAVDESGCSVSGAGDVNGDGFDDLLIGAYGADPNGESGGASYVVFGASTAGSLAVNDASVTEGDAGLTDLTFTVSLSAAATAAVDVHYSTQNGTAQAGSDFTGVDSELLTFAPGETSKLVTIHVAGDTMHELDETLSIVLFDATNAVIFDGTGAGTIRNDDAVPIVNISGGSVLEGDAATSSLTFNVSLSAASGLPATVRYATADDTAVAGSDYTPLTPGTLTFAPGETSKIITIEVVGDTSIEEHERLSIVLSDAGDATVGVGSAIGTILNDDTAIRINDAVSSLEGDSGTQGFTFTVNLEKPSALPVSINYGTADGTATAANDYTALTPGMLTFNPGETSKTITVDVNGDMSVEDHESFFVALAGASNAVIDRGTAAGTILNDDTALRISDAPGILEGDSGTQGSHFNVSLEKPSALPVTVNYATADDTASAGSDFTTPAAGSQLVFAPGEIVKTISIDVRGDTSIEAHEMFSVVLASPTNATIVAGTGIGTILNDDTSLRISDARLLEGHSGTRSMPFTVSLAAASALPVSVKFASADGAATAGADYIALTPGTVDFAPGETSKTIAVDVLGDVAVEPSETFSVVLSEATNAVIDNGTGIGTILDDDVTLAGKRKATFIDVDGDLVTVNVSKGALKVEDFTIFPSGSGAQLALVDFSGETEFAGANLSITAKRAVDAPRGVHLVDVGYINAGGIDLGSVRVKGDLGQIDAGDEFTPKRGLLSLNANSLGHSGLATQLAGGSLQSDIAGALKTFRLADGMQDAAISVRGDIGTIAIKGSVLGSAIRSDGKIGAIKISGDLAATATGDATISARGQLAPDSNAKAIAIASLSIGGSVEHAQILAGYDRTGAPDNADAMIGAVSVGHNWIASNLAAGVSAGTDGLFGTDDDMLIFRDNPIVAKIASIVINGAATGTEDATDHFGFVAEQIGAMKVGGRRLSLTLGASNDTVGKSLGSNGDLQVREVA